LNKNN